MNADCHLGATGINVHNAEVRAYFFPQEGNAYYNAIRYDPTPAAAAPTPAPSYYALLLFALLAQGTDGLRPVTVVPTSAGDVPVGAWEIRAGTQRRLFLINNAATPLTIDAQTPGSRVDLDRLTPYDPTGAGRTLDAPDMRLDGRALAADGSFPGLAPAVIGTPAGDLAITLAPGEAVVVTPHYAETEQTSAVGATVPATLALSLGSPPVLGTFTPGTDRTYDATTTANVISTAGDATLAVSDPSSNATGRLVNGAFALDEPLQVRANANTFAPLGSGPLPLLTYTAPVSNDAVTIGFREHIAANQSLRTGAYGKTLTFTLSTATP